MDFNRARLPWLLWLCKQQHSKWNHKERAKVRHGRHRLLHWQSQQWWLLCTILLDSPDSWQENCSFHILQCLSLLRQNKLIHLFPWYLPPNLSLHTRSWESTSPIVGKRSLSPNPKCTFKVAGENCQDHYYILQLSLPSRCSFRYLRLWKKLRIRKNMRWGKLWIQSCKGLPLTAAISDRLLVCFEL